MTIDRTPDSRPSAPSPCWARSGDPTRWHTAGRRMPTIYVVLIAGALMYVADRVIAGLVGISMGLVP